MTWQATVLTRLYYHRKKFQSIFSIIKQLRSGKQSPVNLVITKLRTKEDLIQKIRLILGKISAKLGRSALASDIHKGVKLKKVSKDVKLEEVS